MFEATTILAYKGENHSVIGGDGQVTFGNQDVHSFPTRRSSDLKGQCDQDSYAL
jgi:ATP-dependent protease HslVU (ClpYQ) peptidase subunit